MKQVIRSTIHTILNDRPLLLLIIGIVFGGLAYTAYAALNVSPTDLQLAVRYTSFGETYFYREKWWYLLSFIGLGVLFIVAHVGIVIKLANIGLRQLAFAFGWLSLLILVLMFVYTYLVFGIAYLN